MGKWRVFRNKFVCGAKKHQVSSILLSRINVGLASQNFAVEGKSKALSVPFVNMPFPFFEINFFKARVLPIPISKQT